MQCVYQPVYKCVCVCVVLFREGVQSAGQELRGQAEIRLSTDVALAVPASEYVEVCGSELHPLQIL